MTALRKVLKQWLLLDCQLGQVYQLYQTNKSGFLEVDDSIPSSLVETELDSQLQLRYIISLPDLPTNTNPFMRENALPRFNPLSMSKQLNLTTLTWTGLSGPRLLFSFYVFVESSRSNCA